MGTQLGVLYVCYGSVEDPLVQTQVVAYLEGLAGYGHRIHLLTFDRRLTRAQKSELRGDLETRGIAWHSLRYHRRPSLLATVFDLLIGSALGVALLRRHRLDAVHARNHVPAAMALIVRRLTGCRFIFDLRGLMADEYADAGLWKRDGVAYRLTQWTQGLALSRADGLAVLTDAVRTHLNHAAVNSDRTVVIPTCADVEQIERSSSDRQAARTEIDADGRPMMVYLGKFSTWYMEREMADYFAVARREQPELLFLIITQADPAPMLAELGRHGFTGQDYRVLKASPDQLGRYLAAAESAISFIRPCLSKIASSPTKIGEYLAAGLPVLSTAGIGDLDALLGDNRVGVLVDEFSEPAYCAAARQMRELCGDPDLPDRCRAVAATWLSLQDVGIPRYEQLYRRVARTGLPGTSNATSL